MTEPETITEEEPELFLDLRRFRRYFQSGQYEEEVFNLTVSLKL